MPWLSASLTTKAWSCKTLMSRQMLEIEAVGNLPMYKGSPPGNSRTKAVPLSQPTSRYVTCSVSSNQEAMSFTLVASSALSPRNPTASMPSALTSIPWPCITIACATTRDHTILLLRKETVAVNTKANLLLL